MGLISWIILGALAGWIGSKIMKTDHQMSGIKNIIVGILGAVIGGGVMNFFSRTGVDGVNLYSLLVALLGSVILLAVFKSLQK